LGAEEEEEEEATFFGAEMTASSVCSLLEAHTFFLADDMFVVVKMEMMET
jgi:hypothetical protein